MGFLTIILIIILIIVLKSAHSPWVTSFKFWEMPVLKYQIRNVVASVAHPLQVEMYKSRTSVGLITNPAVLLTLATAQFWSCCCQLGSEPGKPSARCAWVTLLFWWMYSPVCPFLWAEVAALKFHIFHCRKKVVFFKTLIAQAQCLIP